MANRNVRDVTPFLRKMRAILMGRDPVLNNRWPIQQSAREQPDPNLPDGCSNKLSANYYCSRDGRRLITPPKVVAVNLATSNKTLLLGTTSNSTGAKGEATAVTVTTKKPKIPGVPYNPEYQLNI